MIEETESSIVIQEEFEREILIDRERLLKDLEEFLGMEFLAKVQTQSATIIQINRSRFIECIKFLIERHYNLENILATDGITMFELSYIFSFREYVQKSPIIIQFTIDKSVPPFSLSDLYSNASYLEKNLKNRMGIKFIAPKKDLKESLKRPEYLFTPLALQAGINQKNPLHFGIFNPIHKDYHYIDINSNDGIIKDIQLRDGWQYKKTQPTLEKSNPFNDFSSILETIAPHMNVSQHIAYFQALEDLLGERVEIKAKYIRTLLAELERVQNHLVWFVNLGDLTKTYSLGRKIYAFYIKINQFCQEIFNNPHLNNTIKFKSTIDISMENARNFWIYIKGATSEIFATLRTFLYDDKIQNQLVGKGILSKKRALELGATGPVARASGIRTDIRIDNSYLNYTKGEISQIWDTITFTKGDCFDRAQVRLWEISESLSMIQHILKSLSEYTKDLTNVELPKKYKFSPKKHSYYEVESSEGKFAVYMRTDFKKKKEFLYTVRVLTPDFINFNILNEILKGTTLKEAPLIVHSLNLNFHQIDL